MNQNKTAELIIADLVKSGLVSPENADAVFPYIQQAYGVGYDMGRSMHTLKKPIVQLSIYGHKLKVHESVSIASNKVGVSRSSICQVTSGIRKTAGGFKWKYVEQYEKEQS